MSSRPTPSASRGVSRPGSGTGTETGTETGEGAGTVSQVWWCLNLQTDKRTNTLKYLYKHIKISMVEDYSSAAEFRISFIGFEKYRKFISILNVWELNLKIDQHLLRRLPPEPLITPSSFLDTRTLLKEGRPLLYRLRHSRQLRHSNTSHDRSGNFSLSTPPVAHPAAFIPLRKESAFPIQPRFDNFTTYCYPWIPIMQNTLPTYFSS